MFKRPLIKFAAYSYTSNCELPIKAEREGGPYIFTVIKTKKTFYFAVARLIGRFTLFYARLISCILHILFLLMVKKFYIFASFKQI